MLTDALSISFTWNTTLVLVLLMVVMALIYHVQSLRGLPPFPIRPIPIVGNLLNLDKNPRQQFRLWRKKHGDIFSLYLGQKLCIVMNGYDVLKDALVKHADQLSDRPVSYYDVATNTINMGIAQSSGAQWKEERTTSIRLLRKFGMGKDIMAERINDEIAYFQNELEKLNGQPMDMHNMMNHSTSNVMCDILVGTRFDYNDKQFKRIVALSQENFALLANTAIINFIPQLQHLPGDMFHAKRIKANVLEIMEMFSTYYVKKMESFSENSTDNYVASYLKEKEQKEKSGKLTYMTERNLEKTLTDLLSAGAETASVTLLWWLVYMLNYPEAQKKAFEEIKKEIGFERRPTMNDKTKLNYTNALIMETQRCASVAPLSLLHSCNKDFEFRGYTIPKGACIAPCLDSLLLDVEVWGKDVHEFKPERFFDEDGKIKQYDEFMPFSIGRRACPGKSMAQMELFLYVTNLLQKFEFLPSDPNSLPDLEGFFGLSYRPKHFKLRAKKRCH